MIGINKLNVNWKDDNHVHIQDPDTGHEFEVTVRPKTNQFVAGNPVKARLYVGGEIANQKEDELGYFAWIAWAKEYYGTAASKMLNKELELKYSRKAGCSCGCSPGFIILNHDIPFDVWMDAQ